MRQRPRLRTSWLACVMLCPSWAAARLWWTVTSCQSCQMSPSPSLARSLASPPSSTSSRYGQIILPLVSRLSFWEHGLNLLQIRTGVAVDNLLIYEFSLLISEPVNGCIIALQSKALKGFIPPGLYYECWVVGKFSGNACCDADVHARDVVLFAFCGFLSLMQSCTYRWMLVERHSASVASWVWTSPPQLAPSGSWVTSFWVPTTQSLTMATSVLALLRQLESGLHAGNLMSLQLLSNEAWQSQL